MHFEYGKDIIIPEVLEEDKDFFRWFGGFFDGEGCFNIGVVKYTKEKLKLSRRNFKLHTVVQISQVLDNSECLNEINDILSKYVLPHVFIHWTRNVNDNRRHNVSISVTGINSCIVLSNLLRPFLKTKKDTCDKFLDICYMIKNHKHHTREGFLEICKLRETLNKRTKNFRFWGYEKILGELVFREPKKNNRQLSNIEKDKLKEMYLNGENIVNIARHFGKTVCSINHNLFRMDLKKEV